MARGRLARFMCQFVWEDVKCSKHADTLLKGYTVSSAHLTAAAVPAETNI